MLERFARFRPDGNLAVRIVVVVALGSIVTGIVAMLTDPELAAGGLLADLQAAAEFTGTVIGFALLVAAWGMRRGYRVAYLAAAALVFLAAAHGVAQSRLLSVPLIVLSLGGLAILALTSERFTRSSRLELSATQLGALVAILGVCCYGTAGAYALRGDFDGLDTAVDAVYFTLVTASTVGYGDIHPATETARLFAVSLVVLGPTTVAVAAGSLFGPAIETRLTRTGRRVTNHHDETNRVVVLGYDETTASVVERLADRVNVTVVASDERQLRALPGVVDVVVGELPSAEALERAALETADAVVLAGSEGADTATAVRAATDARLVAVLDPDTESEPRVDAEVVIDPRAIVADAVTDATLGGPDAAAQSSASAASHSG
ncbi:ion channel [Natronococcus sp. A-GB7]|uniref:ion channel n=1 Tax=Natronococcus sp. A-GB7 TaxID=3037649 RepID=UPI00241E647F|nr:ion channel [Natronococcus sp. A-GB7]MDG5821108.1 ion channel [Natronococcus sp. A-GB7]